jgi:hypothetical protein
MSAKVTEEKLTLFIRIADAIEYQAGILSAKAAGYLPYIDVLRLIAQRPEVLSIFNWGDKHDPKLIFTTSQDREIGEYFRKRYLLTAGRIDKARCIPLTAEDPSYQIAIHRPIANGAQNELKFEQRDHSDLRASIEFINKRDSGRRALAGLASNFQRDHLQSLKQRAVEQSSNLNQINQGIEQETHTRVIGSLRVAVEEALDGDAHHALLKRDEVPFLNFFVGLRYALEGRRRDTFDYTAQMILPMSQRDAVKDSLNTNKNSEIVNRLFRGDVEAVLKAMEMPLGPNARAIVDSAICSGTIDFAAEAPGQRRDSLLPFCKLSGKFTPIPGVETNTDNRGDLLRRRAEDVIYGQFGPARLLCVPIHVGGVVYMTAHTFAPLDADKDMRGQNAWFHNYRFYLTIPLIGARLRLGVRRVFLGEVAKELELSLKRYSGDGVLADVNRRWAHLSALFPYGLPFLRRVDQNDNSLLHIPGVGNVELHLLPNPHPCFADPLDFDTITIGEIENVCKREIESKVRRDLEISLSQTTTAAHEISNAIVPPFTSLKWIESNAKLSGASLKHTQLALQWLAFMGATARVRYQISRLHEGRITGKTTPELAFAQLKVGEVQEVVDYVLQYLLSCWAQQLAVARPGHGAINLIYKSPSHETLTSDQAFERLKAWIGGRRTSLQNARFHSTTLQILYADPVAWPMAFLRELVQNIRLDDPMEDDDGRTIRFSYDWKTSVRNPSLLVLQTTQQQRQMNRFPGEMHKTLPEGLQKANRVYGRDGAGFGEMVLLGLSQDRESATNSYRVAYRLAVNFFGIKE